ncbi:hypothetical protein FACS1894132_06600 [Clostridia bacterium]|nr:hypothetical protein FACS1894132_06600 [Clostridia bacterium]
MTKKNENTALAVQSDNGYLALANFDFDTDISEVLDGLNISFGKIKIQTGAYEVPNEGDDTETVKEFSGVILFHHTLNAYYATKYTGGSNPPDCGSFDGVTGEGNPGGNCKTCRYNQFGTGENGAKACKNRRRVYILREGEVFPLLLSLPTGSLKMFTKYIKAQLSKGRKSSAIVTRFSLKKVTNSTGIAFSQANFALDRALTPEEYALIAPMTEQIKSYAVRVGFDNDSAAIDEEATIDLETGEVIEPLGGNRNV